MVKTLRFADGVEVPVPGFGAMGINFAMGNNLSYDEAEPLLLKALELGCTFWDTAVRCTSPSHRLGPEHLRRSSAQIHLQPLLHSHYLPDFTYAYEYT